MLFSQTKSQTDFRSHFAAGEKRGKGKDGSGKGNERKGQKG